MNTATRNNSRYGEPAFVICVVVLSLVAGGMSVAEKKLGWFLKKEPLPLKRSLNAMDEAALTPYAVISKQAIQTAEVLTSLGTTDYIQWVLEDLREPTDSPVRYVMLFVTYYALPDRVPHVPEECYTGGGYQRLATEAVRFRMDGPEGPEEIPGRCLVFGVSGANRVLSASRFPVLYSFRVNGEYCGNRDQARLALNKNIFSPYSYFCKVELVFNQALAAPSTEQAIAAGQRLLVVLLPLLERDHWPEWPAHEGGHSQQITFDSISDVGPEEAQAKGK